MTEWRLTEERLLHPYDVISSEMYVLDDLAASSSCVSWSKTVKCCFRSSTFVQLCIFVDAVHSLRLFERSSSHRRTATAVKRAWAIHGSRYDVRLISADIVHIMDSYIIAYRTPWFISTSRRGRDARLSWPIDLPLYVAADSFRTTEPLKPDWTNYVAAGAVESGWWSVARRQTAISSHILLTPSSGLILTEESYTPRRSLLRDCRIFDLNTVCFYETE